MDFRIINCNLSLLVFVEVKSILPMATDCTTTGLFYCERYTIMEIITVMLSHILCQGIVLNVFLMLVWPKPLYFYKMYRNLSKIPIRTSPSNLDRVLIGHLVKLDSFMRCRLHVYQSQQVQGTFTNLGPT